MKLLTFRSGQDLKLGVKNGAHVLDVAAAARALGGTDAPCTPEALVCTGSAGLPALARLVREAADLPEFQREEASLSLGPAVPAPGKIICIGLNYRRHAFESGMAIPATPVVFSKFGNAVAAHGQEVPLPSVAVEYDYEVELALVMGREARNVTEAAALDYVLGFATANDLSARDLQMRTTQWLLGKSLDRFLPLGPCLVTRDEVPDPQNLALRSWVNGELRQNSNTSDMIFSCAYLISYLSRYMTLSPGDVIATGTPEGVILGMKEKRWLRPGDAVTVEVEGMGRLTSYMA